MYNYEQIKNFYPKDMGTKKGWCLQNVAKGYHIYPSGSPSASAKADMQRNISNGTYHSGTGDIPTNCAVPVYIRTSNPNGHIEVCDRGVYYSDGKVVKNQDVLGWGEWCNGYQIVKKGTTKSFLPAKGYWCIGDEDPRVGDLALFMRTNFPAYTSAKALGNYYGKYLASSITEFQKRTGLYPDGCTGPKTYDKLKSYGFVY